LQPDLHRQARSRRRDPAARVAASRLIRAALPTCDTCGARIGDHHTRRRTLISPRLLFRPPAYAVPDGKCCTMTRIESSAPVGRLNHARMGSPYGPHRLRSGAF
jgi:hypothetical protein